MAQITITIPDSILNRVLDAVALEFNYTSNQQGGETKAAFAKRMLIQLIKSIVARWEIGTAEASARATATTSVNADIILT